MKIGLDIGNKAINEYTPMMENHGFTKTEQVGAVRYDRSDSRIGDNVYAKHGKTTEEVMLEAGAVDVATARNYMTVMSNTMSDEDYQKMMKDGFDPASMSGEESCNILDHIKAVMAESGQVVAGYNDDLDDSVLKEVTGKNIDLDKIKDAMESMDIPATADNIKKINEAIAMMTDIAELPDGSVKYMVDNDLEPTIQNIYTSRYSATADGSRQARGYYAQDNGYYARKADDTDYEALRPQIEKTIEQVELEDVDKEELFEDAKWLLDKGLPVTEQKLEELEEIKSIEWPVPVHTVIGASIRAIAAGLEPKDANLSPKHKGIYEKAYEQRTALINAQIGREESRLRMSIDANIRLVRKGITLDTHSMEEVIEALKKEEQNLKEQFFGEGLNTEELDRREELFVKTTTVIEQLPTLPAASLGNISVSDHITLTKIHTEGTALQSRLEAAGQSYEALGTEVRKDLGDSITKAFRNVDDIIRSLGMEVNETNERAVRILGYNSMVINEEAIRKVVETDNKVQNLIKNLTPGKTLQLIREGINPLDLDIDEVVNHIDQMDTDPKRDAQKYSKFLYKLEKAGEITEEEKSSYIGIYRLINKLERTDHAAVGRLLDSGANITFGNLLTAMRSAGKTFNVNIDDNFGLLGESISRGISITDQIEAAFVSRVGVNKDASYEKSYAEESLSDIRELSGASDEVIEEIVDNNVEVTPDNIEAQLRFSTAPNELFRYTRAYSRRLDSRTESSSRYEDMLNKAIDDMEESLSDRESASEGYEKLTEVVKETLGQMADVGADTLIDLKSITLMYKQVSLAKNYAREENYHVPVSMNGRIMDINLKLVHGNEKGLVTATMETEEYGKVATSIRVAGGKIEAVMIGENATAVSDLQNIAGIFEQKMNEEGYEEITTRCVTGNPTANSKLSEEKADNNNETVDTAGLYKIAKLFIQSVKTA